MRQARGGACKQNRRQAMLYARLGAPMNPFIEVDRQFKRFYERSWLDDPLVKEIIRDVDKSEPVGDYVIKSPRLGLINYEQLPGGVKQLLMMHKGADHGFDYVSTLFGDNCSKWILRISEDRDLTLWITHYLRMPEDMATPVTFPDLGMRVVTGRDEYDRAVVFNPDLVHRDTYGNSSFIFGRRR
jgi:hypothetical protein